MNRFQILCSCIKCKKTTTTGQLTRNHKDKCPVDKKSVKFPENKGRVAWNKGLSKATNPIIASHAAALAEKFANGDLHPKGCRGWTKDQLRENAKLHKTGGYRANAGRSKKFRLADSFGNNVCLQSSYELRCAQILNELGIQWIRPSYLKYGDKKYFPDFYLTDYRIYLDPKNSYLIKKDAEKIRLASEENNAIIYMLKEEQLTTEYMKHLLTDS